MVFNQFNVLNAVSTNELGYSHCDDLLSLYKLLLMSDDTPLKITQELIDGFRPKATNYNALARNSLT